MIQLGKVTRQWLAEQNWGMPALSALQENRMSMSVLHPIYVMHMKSNSLIYSLSVHSFYMLPIPLHSILRE
jgi:hypothetical protein